MMKELTVAEKKGFVQMAEGLLECYDSVERIEHHSDGLLVYGKNNDYRFALTFGEHIVCLMKRMSYGTEENQTLVVPSDEVFFNALREFFLEDALLLEDIELPYYDGLENELN